MTMVVVALRGQMNAEFSRQKLKPDDSPLPTLICCRLLRVKRESHQSPRADLPGAVAALTCQVLVVSQEARGPRALER